MWMFLPFGRVKLCVPYRGEGIVFKRLYPSEASLGESSLKDSLACIDYDIEDEVSIVGAFGEGGGVYGIASIHAYDPLSPPSSLRTVVGCYVDDPSLVSGARLVKPNGVVEDVAVEVVGRNLVVAKPYLPRHGLYYIMFKVGDGMLATWMFFRPVNKLYHKIRWLRFMVLIALSKRAPIIVV